MPKVLIHTDGSCWPNPGGTGGWGAVIVRDGVRSELRGHIPAPCTNNRAELTAAIEALRSLPEPSSVTLTTDSEYLKKGASEWMWRWHRKDWRKVKNADLWQQVWELCGRHNVIWEWVRGHSTNAENNRCDAIADQMRAVADHKATHSGLLALQQEILSQPPYADDELAQDGR